MWCRAGTRSFALLPLITESTKVLVEEYIREETQGDFRGRIQGPVWREKLSPITRYNCARDSSTWRVMR